MLSKGVYKTTDLPDPENDDQPTSYLEFDPQDYMLVPRDPKQR